MPYTAKVPEPKLRVTVQGDALRELFWARELFNAVVFQGQRRMSLGAAVHVLTRLLREKVEREEDCGEGWMMQTCHELAPKLGRPKKEPLSMEEIEASLG